ncbi:TonB-dependent receptor domain-containing protein [Emticicia sp.]|uniref:TonB-dependent receptor n=1 Tax=Emticicia sp. TaxID=1930953 RepID=UPI00375046C6
MKRISFIILLTFYAFSSIFAQNIKIRVQDDKNHEPLIGATIKPKNNAKSGALADIEGIVEFKNLPLGKQIFEASSVGYETKTFEVELPFANNLQPFVVQLSASESDLEEVTVSAFRTNSRIEDLPIKVEVLGQEDMDEESTIVPGNVSSILGDISIIHVQRTSATNGNQAIRMQGLDPKYTQILRDGLPLYEGFSGNLGVLAIPPLDLKQVEVVKGSVSTLYGGGAIGGMINLVSKAPTSEKPEVTMVVNRTTLKETNINAYYAQKYDKIGLTFFTGYTHQQAVDVDGDSFSDSPLIRQFTFHPRFFWQILPKSKINIGYSFVKEKRQGGYLAPVFSSSLGFVSTTDFQRHTIDYNFNHEFRKGHTFTFKGASSNFERTNSEAAQTFGGKQTSSYIEASDFIEKGKIKLIVGSNLILENFKKNVPDNTLLTNYQYQTLGFFIQNDWQIVKKLSLQTGIRIDNHNVFGNFFLPRISLMTKPSEHFTIRWSVGTGYKTPNVFANLTPNNAKTSLDYWSLLPLSKDIKSESSIGSNIDMAYQGTIGEKLVIQLDQAFYYTNIKNPIVAVSDGTKTRLQNASYAVNSIGTDTYLRMTLDDYELYLGYNHTLARRVNSTEKVYLPFSPQDKFSLTAAYSVEGKWRFGIESSWVGNQYLFDNQRVKNYWFWALAIERKFGEHISLVVNGENLLNIRQSNFEKTVTGTSTNPSFMPIWAPLEGRVINLALKLKL